MHRLALAALILCVLFVPSLHARDFDSALRAAMKPYYAALVASARGDAEGTRRQLVLFQALWSSAQREASSAPAPLRADSQWPRDLAAMSAAIGRAQALLRSRDVEGAHAELESIRITLRDARARHGLTNEDDMVLEFHDALERLVSRVPHRNEVRLRAGDYQDLQPLVDASHRQWEAVTRRAGSAASTGWQTARARVDAGLRAMADAVRRQDAAALSAAAAALKDGYFELLLKM